MRNRSRSAYACIIGCLYVLYCSISCQRSDNVIPGEEPKLDSILIRIDRTDTVYLYLEHAPKIEDQFIDSLKFYLGTRELTGNNDGEVVSAIIKSCGINTPAAWCACYLHHNLLKINRSGPSYQPAFSPRWFEDPNRVVWTRQDENAPISKGDVCGIYFRNLKRVAHVLAVIEDTRDGYVITIEGNTNGAGSREGNGVFIRIRHKSELYICSNWLNL